MANKVKEIIRKTLAKKGFKIIKNDIPLLDKDFVEIMNKCKDYTMTSEERMFSLYLAVRYIVEAKIPGDFVECGVWKGGSSMIIAYTLLKMGINNRKIYLYDTFEGMPEPGEEDVYISKKEDVKNVWSKETKKEKWLFSPLEEVRKNLLSIGYPEENLIFIKGKVEETIPKTISPKISLLRLDTDWYSSTYHEMKYLFPKLSKNGILLLDDYNYWKGSKDAVDKYLEETKTVILLNRIDSSGRIGVKI